MFHRQFATELDKIRISAYPEQ